MILESIWTETDDARAPIEASLPEGPVDVAIVGGGFTGLSAAYHLARTRPGLRAVALEAGRLGAGASGRNTGMLGPGVGQSFLSLVKRLGLVRAGALYRETLAAVAFARTLIEREGIACELSMPGQLLLARTRTERGRLARQLSFMRALALPVAPLDDAALRLTVRLAALPAGSDRDGPAALRFPDAGLLHPGKLLAGLAAACACFGVRVVENAAVREVTGGATGAVRLALSSGAVIVADRAVIATAGYTPSLGLLRGRVLPVSLQVIATAPLPKAALQAVGWAGREGVVEARRLFSYFRLTPDDRLIFGGGAPRYRWGGQGDRAALASRPLHQLQRAAVATFAGRLDPALLAPTHGWTGTIGYVLDGLPLAGPLPGRPRIVFAGGWCGHGLALSLACGPRVAALCGFSDQGQPGGAWFRGAPESLPPLVPSEAVRWLAFRGAVAGMALADRVGA